MGRLLVFSVFGFALTSFAVAQQHVFTNKGGVQIIAEIESVDLDWKKMTIRKDGSTFDIEPRVLVLDDQQFVKNWLKERGITAPGQEDLTTTSSNSSSINLDAVRIDVELKKKLVDSDRTKYSSYTRLETRKYSYDITVSSRGRETIPGAKIQYAVVWKESVSVSGNDYDSFYGDNNKFAVIGEKSVPNLIYNRDENITTDIVEINSVIQDGNEVYREDKLLGVVVNVELADGTQVMEYLSPAAKDIGLSWATVKRLPPRPGAKRREMGERNDDEGEGEGEGKRYTFQLKKGESRDGPIDLRNKRITISATVRPDAKSPDGIIASIGGYLAGVSLYIKERKVYGSVSNQSKIEWVAKAVPLGSFDAVLELNEEGLSLSVGDGSPSKRGDISLFRRVALDGITVGNTPKSPSGEYPDNFDFAGEIENARILIRE